MERSIIHTPLGAMHLIRAGAPEAREVLAIMREAAEWLRSRGLDQWAVVLSEPYEEYLRQRVAQQEVYLAWHGDQGVGTVCVQWQDARIWGQQGEDGLAGYIHGLAIRRSVTGQSIGEHLLGWAEGHIAFAGRRLIRLDCMAANPALCAYYIRQGFREVGLKEGTGWKSRLYEKPAHVSSQRRTEP